LLVAGFVVISATSAVADTGLGAPSPEQAFLAKVIVPTEARSEPAGGVVVARLSTHAKIFAGANQLLILDVTVRDGTQWVKVRLPQRPNDAAGWVSTDGLVITTTPYRLDVSVSQRTVTLLKAGRPVARSEAVLGAKRTPTPTGLFAVSETVAQPRGGKLGPLILALTAHSDVHKTFEGGDGRIGLHSYEKLGAKLGTRSSNGCIRLPTGFVKRIAGLVSPGTPVQIS
jgi:lipoprotein-anchoring transpeptidase ErfK/SrfK